MRRLIEACTAALLASCNDPAGTETQGEASSSVTGGLTLPTGDISAGENKFDLGLLDLGGPDCGLNNGDLGLSYIWIANSTQGTVSKIEPLRTTDSDEYGGIQRFA
jgi:hypothetical protein